MEFWVLEANNVPDTIFRKTLGLWFFAEKVGEGIGKRIRNGDRAVIYERVGARTKRGGKFVGSLTFDSEVIQSRTGEYYPKGYFARIREVELWLTESPSYDDATQVATLSLPRPGHPQWQSPLIPIEFQDYKTIVKAYGFKLESKSVA
jgi:hypothetical protein